MNRVKNAKSLIVLDANTKIKPPNGSAHTLHTSANIVASTPTARLRSVRGVEGGQVTMSDLQLHIKSCPYCNHQASIEKALYAPDGHQLSKDEEHPHWIAKCPECGARTEYQPSRLSAIIAWNRGQFNEMTKILNLEHNTKNPEPWYKLRDAIILVQTEDLKAEAIKREARRAAGGRVGSKLEGESWFYSPGYERLGGPDGDAIVRGIKAQAPYLYWKERMDCAHCAVKELECPHKRDNSEWRAFNKGIARGCVKREGGN